MQKIIKSIFIFFLAVTLFPFWSCKSLSNDIGGEKIGIVVSIPPQAEFAERVGGEKVYVTVMVPPGASPHTYEPTPGQLREVSMATLYLKVGSGVEFELTWMDKITETNSNIHVFDCSEGISLLDNDPHIWLSASNAIVMVENIYQGLVKTDPENKDFYCRNKIDFQSELSLLDEDIKEILKDKKNRKIMVYHPAWTYFAASYDLELITIEEEGKEPSMTGIKKIIEQAEEYNIKVVFASPEISARSAEVIADEIDGSVILISPLEKDYIKNMRYAATAFAESML